MSSTDAAVFSPFKSTGLRIKECVSATLQAESGLNDPLAVLLTIVAIGLVLAEHGTGQPWRTSELALMVFKQVGWGLLLGVLSGLIVLKLIRLSRLQMVHNVGLNTIFLLATGMSVFAQSNWLGVSGFLAIYLLGAILGNTSKCLVRHSIPALNGLAWLFQSVMLLLLGLLATPTQVVQSILMGLALSLTLIFIARPLASIPF